MAMDARAKASPIMRAHEILHGSRNFSRPGATCRLRRHP
jgi:hypothetical protein